MSPGSCSNGCNPGCASHYRQTRGKIVRGGGAQMEVSVCVREGVGQVSVLGIGRLGEGGE